MAAKKISFDPIKLMFARWQYEETDTPTKTIADELGCAKTTLHLRINELGWRRRLERAPRLLPPAPPATPPAAAASAAALVGEAAPACDLLSTADALARMVEGEIGVLNVIIAQARGTADGGQMERVARTAASLARTLRELQVMRAAPPPPRGRGARRDDDEELPVDIDELRHALAARIEALVAQEEENERYRQSEEFRAATPFP